jgi:hypothetical protein
LFDYISTRRKKKVRRLITIKKNEHVLVYVRFLNTGESGMTITTNLTYDD